jgi:flagellar hook protein FlgE
MVGALWTGISGLAGQQTALDNESNNIANVNTIGYKSSRLSFADQMYQDKIGKGVTILDAEKLYTQGNLKLTGVSYDMALSGDGFFAVSNTRGSGASEVFYTRAGNFRMGDNGKLQDSAGNEVQGWAMATLDPDADVVTTNDNVKRFTDDYVKLASSQIIKKSTSIETITAKMTDYTITAKADSEEVMTGAGFKTKSTKISDVELLISSYSSKLKAYSSQPDAVSTPSVAQNSWLDFDLDTATVDSGDQIYVYIDGTKYAQSFDTDENTTIKKLVDKLSNIPGLNAYIGDSTTAIYPTPNANVKPDGSDPTAYVIIESLIPGNTVTIGDVGIVHDGTTILKKSGTNTSAIDGTGYGAVLSAMEALRDAVAGKQNDIWGEKDIGTLGTDDKIKYSLNVGDRTYTIEVQEGETTVTTDPGDTTAATINALSNENKIDELVKAINSHSEMSKKIVARNYNGNLVIESLKAGEEFNGFLSVDYQPSDITVKSGDLNDGDTIVYDFAGNAVANDNVINKDEELQLKLTLGGKDYVITLIGESKQATVYNGTTTYSVTLPNILVTANAAEMMAYAIEHGDPVLANELEASKDPNNSNLLNIKNKTGGAGDATNVSHKLGDNALVTPKNSNSAFSVNTGTGAEFMQIKTVIDQTASKGSLQLRLDTLGISDSAFGDFSVDSSGLITMKQDGAEFAIGQVAIALFNDNRGLEPRGDNLLATTTRSGPPIYNINNNKTADVKSKTLELSTADLSKSLVNLMVFQRAFEANAKSITTADTILNTLIQLKR